jgi:drug/metabolite transporter (DMT)-like permease
MEITQVVLVVLSGFLHSIWNFLTKKSVDKLVFLYLAKVFELVIFFPLFFYLLRSTYINPKAYVFVVLSGIANTVYWFSLSKAYTYSDLSLVYPIARSAPAFIAIIAIALGIERLTLTGLMGIILVNSGVFMITFENGKFLDKLQEIVRLKDIGVSFAFLTLLSVIAYSFIDKQASTLINPILYVYLFEFVSFVLLSFIVLKTKSAQLLETEFRKNSLSIIASAILIVVSYAIVVFVMRTGSLSYIVSIREVGIIFGVLEGVLFLKEPFQKRRIIASIIIALGIVIISIA